MLVKANPYISLKGIEPLHVLWIESLAQHAKYLVVSITRVNDSWIIPVLQGMTPIALQAHTHTHIRSRRFFFIKKAGFLLSYLQIGRAQS